LKQSELSNLRQEWSCHLAINGVSVYALSPNGEESWLIQKPQKISGSPPKC